MTAEVFVYPDGQLRWVCDVPLEPVDSSGLLQPKAGCLSDDAISLCLLNEARIKYAAFEVAHYIMKDFSDDGPPSIEQIVEVCRLIEEKVQAGKQLRLWCPEGKKYASHRSFSALCAGAHRILVRGDSAKDAASSWAGMKIGFLAYSWVHKIQPLPARSLSLYKCLQALEFARDSGWLDVRSFDGVEWRKRWHTYDLTCVIPNEILLGSDPLSTIIDPDPATVKYLTEDDRPASDESSTFASFLSNEGVKLIVRVNFPTEAGLKESYDPQAFVKHGFRHLDSPFVDLHGGVPPSNSLKRILDECRDMAKGEVIYFHCKGGFGRSGLCAAVLAIDRYDVPGDVVLAWWRMCRPGTFTTQQQVDFVSKLQGRADVEKLFAPLACCVVA